ncbi:MAG TPA: GNAT family N-acetyltransferase [Pseudobdellovibrionaceae bacterium]|nr:GNAT family N-acetyltransferase [Pseudobdellovibrionaceae bacterium]
MNELSLVRANGQNDLERFYPVMKELRKDLSYQDFLSLYEKAHEADSYEVVGLEDQGKIIAVMGYRILYDFVHGKHLYIDDLVSTESQRSKGLGAKLLNYAEELAIKHSCKGMRLCTGIENEQGKKFYDRNGWNLRSVAYKKKLNK